MLEVRPERKNREKGLFYMKIEEMFEEGLKVINMVR